MHIQMPNIAAQLSKRIWAFVLETNPTKTMHGQKQNDAYLMHSNNV